MKNDTDKARSEKKPKTNGIEGEGNYNASRNYAKGVARSVAAGKTDELATKAKKALEGREGAELEAAERKAKQRAKS